MGGYLGGMGVREGGGGGYVWIGELIHIGRPWMNVFVRVLQKLAKIRVIIYKI